jgi:hypothetical protein
MIPLIEFTIGGMAAVGKPALGHGGGPLTDHYLGAVSSTAGNQL